MLLLIPVAWWGWSGPLPLVALGGVAVAVSAAAATVAGWRRWLAAPAACLAVGAAVLLLLRPQTSASSTGAALGALALAGCLPLLVWRRRLPVGPSRLLGVTLWCWAAGGSAAVLAGIGSEAVALLLPAAKLVWPALAGLVAVVALELLGRQALGLLRPGRPTLADDSLIAGLLAGDLGPVRAVRAACGLEAGLADWVRVFLGRALPPLAVAIALVGWASTGLTGLGLAECGVLERGGAARRVLGPGLHAHLPWPWERVRRFELGVERATPLGDLLAEAPPPVAADGVSSAAEDRLWDTAHAREILFLTAGRVDVDRRGVRPVGITNADVVVHWRLRADPAGILAAAYAATDAEALVLRQARRRVQAVFAAATPEALIGADRQALAERMRVAVQEALDRHGAGLEVTAVRIEAIHPPRAAAAAQYQAQAAAREAVAQVSHARSQAAAILAGSRVQAANARDEALARRAELVGGARIQAERGRAEAAALDLGEAAMLEARLEALHTALAGRRLLVLDHRLPAGVEHRLDLRPTALSTDQSIGND